MIPKFKIGDIVRLNSNDIRMTIHDIESEVKSLSEFNKTEFKGNYLCIWHDDFGKLYKDSFHEDELVLVQ